MEWESEFQCRYIEHVESVGQLEGLPQYALCYSGGLGIKREVLAREMDLGVFFKCM